MKSRMIFLIESEDIIPHVIISKIRHLGCKVESQGIFLFLKDLPIPNKFLFTEEQLKTINREK